MKFSLATTLITIFGNDAYANDRLVNLRGASNRSPTTAASISGSSLNTLGSQSTKEDPINAVEKGAHHSMGRHSTDQLLHRELVQSSLGGAPPVTGALLVCSDHRPRWMGAVINAADCNDSQKLHELPLQSSLARDLEQRLSDLENLRGIEIDDEKQKISLNVCIHNERPADMGVVGQIQVVSSAADCDTTGGDFFRVLNRPLAIEERIEALEADILQMMRKCLPGHTQHGTDDCVSTEGALISFCYANTPGYMKYYESGHCQRKLSILSAGVAADVESFEDRVAVLEAIAQPLGPTASPTTLTVPEDGTLWACSDNTGQHWMRAVVDPSDCDTQIGETVHELPLQSSLSLDLEQRLIHLENLRGIEIDEEKQKISVNVCIHKGVAPENGVVGQMEVVSSASDCNIAGGDFFRVVNRPLAVEERIEVLEAEVLQKTALCSSDSTQHGFGASSSCVSTVGALTYVCHANDFGYMKEIESDTHCPSSGRKPFLTAAVAADEQSFEIRVGALEESVHSPTPAPTTLTVPQDGTLLVCSANAGQQWMRAVVDRSDCNTESMEEALHGLPVQSSLSLDLEQRLERLEKEKFPNSDVTQSFVYVCIHKGVAPENGVVGQVEVVSTVMDCDVTGSDIFRVLSLPLEMEERIEVLEAEVLQKTALCSSDTTQQGTGATSSCVSTVGALTYVCHANDWAYMKNIESDTYCPSWGKKRFLTAEVTADEQSFDVRVAALEAVVWSSN